jgi:hypothetical protein
MSQWAGGVLTAAGRALQAKVEAGTTLTLTRIKLGDGTEQMSAVDSLTDLVGPKAILGISSATSEDDVATITGVMSATQLTAGFYCREWGLFAQDPDVGEILYMITIDAQPEWLPASTEAAQVSATYAMNIAVANATNIEVNIDPAGLVDVDMLNEILGVAERSKAYSVGDLASMPGLPAEHYLRCITAGTTGTNTPVLPANIKDGDKISDGTVMWQVTKAMSAAELGYRQPSTAYAVGAIAYHSALPTGWYLECTTAGTTGSGDITPTSTIGSTVSDGTVVWTVRMNLSTNGKVFENILYAGNTKELYIASSTDVERGGFLRLNSANHATRPGRIAMYASDGTYQSRIELMSDGEAKIYKADNTMLDLAGSAIAAKSLGTNGYIKYASGLIMQWGSDSFTDTMSVSDTVEVTFPVSFTTANNFISCTARTNSGAYAAAFMTNGVTAAYARIRRYPGNTAVTFNWFAIGY